MTGLVDLETLLTMMTQVHAALAEALPSTTDPEVREYLEPLVADLANHRAELAKLYPQAMLDLQTRREALIQQAADLQREVDAWHARIDAMEAKAAKGAPAEAPAAPAPTPSGKQPRKPADTDPGDGSIWRDADDTSSWAEESTGADPSAATDAPRAPDKGAKAPDVAWDGGESIRDFDDPSSSSADGTRKSSKEK